jgi:hypothetical protein
VYLIYVRVRTTRVKKSCSYLAIRCVNGYLVNELNSSFKYDERLESIVSPVFTYSEMVFNFADLVGHCTIMLIWLCHRKEFYATHTSAEERNSAYYLHNKSTIVTNLQRISSSNSYHIVIK